MAKKRQSQKKAAHLRQQQKANRPAARLDEAANALKEGDLATAVAQAESALNSANDAATITRAQQLAAEALFRQAAQTGPKEQLRLLNQARKHVPDQARLRYHAALAAWRNGATDEAAKVDVPSEWTGGAYLQQLTNLATGKKTATDGLSEAEQNTLALLAAIKASTRKGKNLPDVPDGPLLGDAELWSVLLQMLESESSQPAVTFEKARTADPATAANPVLRYYAGVLAMRQRNQEEAMAAWRALAQALHTPWLVENLHLQRREQAAALADQGNWQGVVALYEESRKTVPTDEMDPAFHEVAGHAYFHLGFAAGQAEKWRDAYGHFATAAALIKGRLLAQNLALAAEKIGRWTEAAEAWREMVRRRPRKTDHPDYLNDQQVAAIWVRAAVCYEHDEDLEEAITCFKNAVKYNEENIEIRMHLVDLYGAEERFDAAENELNRILAIDKNHIPALVRLATIYSGDYYRGNAKAIWQRILAIDPTHEDARMGLAIHYAELAQMQGMGMYMGFRPNTKRQSEADILKEGLQEVPDHPVLLVELGKYYHENSQYKQARTQLLRAAEVAPRDVRTLGIVLHELLHAKGEDAVRELAPKVRQIPGLRPGFWVEQGEQALGCEFGPDWARFFWDIAVDVAEPMRGEDSQAATLLAIFDEAVDMEEEALADHYAKIITDRHSQSGAPEYVQALRLFQQDPSKKKPIQAQLRKAQANAEKAKEPGVAQRAEQLDEEVKYGDMMPFFGRGNPLADLFGNLDELDIDEEDLFDAFRRTFR